ncbi:MAG: hypothetical protein SFV17_21470 [Candidatus Obscuribacter sp.]|nr:hypothetical protein [Candidatus Obscuribacter sp.]
MNTTNTSNCAMANLTGKTVKALFLSRDQSILVVLHSEGYSEFETFADCCSETWFADIVGVQNLLGHTVMSAEDIQLEAIEDGRTRQESDLFYGIKLVTTGGYVDLVYRNSSNGYYGGWLCQACHHDKYDCSDMLELTEDYSA